jgi:hypothetical protein
MLVLGKISQGNPALPGYKTGHIVLVTASGKPAVTGNLWDFMWHNAALQLGQEQAGLAQTKTLLAILAGAGTQR